MQVEKSLRKYIEDCRGGVEIELLGCQRKQSKMNAVSWNEQQASYKGYLGSEREESRGSVRCRKGSFGRNREGGDEGRGDQIQFL